MHEFESNYGRWIIANRWWVLLATIVLIMSAGSGGQHLRFTNDYRLFFSDDNPQLLAFEALENTYTKNDNVMFVVVPEDGQVFSPQALAAVEWLTEEAW